MDIDFQTYTLWDRPEAWITIGVGGAFILTSLVIAFVLWVKNMRKKEKERDFMPSFILVVVALILPLFLGAPFIAYAKDNAKLDTINAAVKATKSEIQKVYGIDIPVSKTLQLVGYYNVLKLDNPPKEDVFTFGTTNTLVNGEVTPLTLASVNGEIQLLTGEDTLKELPKKN